MSGKKKKKIDKLGIDIVSGCQLKCIGCPNSTIKKKIETMGLSLFDTIMRRLSSYRVKLLRLYNFGEPFLHNRLKDILDLIPDNVKSVEISTNGQVIKEGIIDHPKLTYLAISCDGNGTKEEYERLRPPAKWEKLIEFMKFASKYPIKKEARIIGRGDRWGFLLGEYGIKPSFRNMHRFADTRFEVKSSKGVCPYMEANNLYINHIGDVVPCCAHPMAAVLGNIDDIGSAFKAKDLFHKRMKRERYKMPVCGRCGL